MIPIILWTATTICTASLKFPAGTQFTYTPSEIVLNVPEYNNATTKTAGFPGCFSGSELMGWSNKKPIGGFTLDDESSTTKI